MILSASASEPNPCPTRGTTKTQNCWLFRMYRIFIGWFLATKPTQTTGNERGRQATCSIVQYFDSHFFPGGWMWWRHHFPLWACSGTSPFAKWLQLNFALALPVLSLTNCPAALHHLSRTLPRHFHCQWQAKGKPSSAHKMFLVMILFNNICPFLPQPGVLVDGIDRSFEFMFWFLNGEGGWE